KSDPEGDLSTSIMLPSGYSRKHFTPASSRTLIIKGKPLTKRCFRNCFTALFPFWFKAPNVSRVMSQIYTFLKYNTKCASPQIINLTRGHPPRARNSQFTFRKCEDPVGIVVFRFDHSLQRDAGKGLLI